jgi:prevent-host-death family protein
MLPLPARPVLAGSNCDVEVEIYAQATACYIHTMKAVSLEPEIVTRKGKPVSVIIPIKDYVELLERVEDAADVAWLKRARRKPQRYRPLDDYLAGRNCK